MTLKEFQEEMRRRNANFSEVNSGIRWLCHEKWGSRNGEIYYQFFWGHEGQDWDKTDFEKRVQ